MREMIFKVLNKPSPAAKAWPFAADVMNMAARIENACEENFPSEGELSKEQYKQKISQLRFNLAKNHSLREAARLWRVLA